MKNLNQPIALPSSDISLFIKREDLIHPTIPGNKYRKLKYNLEAAAQSRKSTLLTFGGAFSNHIAAVAAAGQKFGFKTIGIIRGEELVNNIGDNPTLAFAVRCGMKLIFTTRELYRDKNIGALQEFNQKDFSECYMIPEGGTNDLAVRGCQEILTDDDRAYDYICCSVGTGGTIAGIINAAAPHQQVLGFPALKGDFLSDEICKFATAKNWQLVPDYHFGGYAKINAELVGFMNDFSTRHGMLVDPVYTGKLLFGVMDMIERNKFRANSKILVIHTGGQQGIAGMNIRLKNKNLPLINTDV